MAQILVRNLDEEVVRKLKRRAKLLGRSLQSEAKRILEEAAEGGVLDKASAFEMADAFRKSLKGRKFSDSAKLVREDRGL
jgi:antitoxin FitA